MAQPMQRALSQPRTSSRRPQQHQQLRRLHLRSQRHPSHRQRVQVASVGAGPQQHLQLTQWRRWRHLSLAAVPALGVPKQHAWHARQRQLLAMTMTTLLAALVMTSGRAAVCFTGIACSTRPWVVGRAWVGVVMDTGGPARLQQSLPHSSG
jgi:hypothetical protein